MFGIGQRQDHGVHLQNISSEGQDQTKVEAEKSVVEFVEKLQGEISSFFDDFNQFIAWKSELKNELKRYEEKDITTQKLYKRLETLDCNKSDAITRNQNLCKSYEASLLAIEKADLSQLHILSKEGTQELFQQYRAIQLQFNVVNTELLSIKNEVIDSLGSVVKKSKIFRDAISTQTIQQFSVKRLRIPCNFWVELSCLFALTEYWWSIKQTIEIELENFPTEIKRKLFVEKIKTRQQTLLNDALLQSDREKNENLSKILTDEEVTSTLQLKLQGIEREKRDIEADRQKTFSQIEKERRLSEKDYLTKEHKVEKEERILQLKAQELGTQAHQEKKKIIQESSQKLMTMMEDNQKKMIDTVRNLKLSTMNETAQEFWNILNKKLKEFNLNNAGAEQCLSCLDNLMKIYKKIFNYQPYAWMNKELEGIEINANDAPEKLNAMIKKLQSSI